MAQTYHSPAEGIPGTPGIREVRSEPVDVRIGLNETPSPETRNAMHLRTEIDTSPPFGSVKEAVTRFGGSGAWVPLYKLGENGIEEFDIKKVEEQAAELEKDLIVKELETLDVLEELGTTKRVVEELKRQLQAEALKCFPIPDDHSYEQMSSPAVKEMNKENFGNSVNNQEQIMDRMSTCTTSPELILLELKQAKVNLGKTINDLGVIQSSVESLNKKMKKEKAFIQRTHNNLESKFAGVSAQEEDQSQAKLNPPMVQYLETRSPFHDSACIKREIYTDAEQYKGIAEKRQSEASKPLSAYGSTGIGIKTAEMKLIAAKKMEEAARAAEAVALAEIKALSSDERTPGFILPEPEKVAFSFNEQGTPLTPRAQVSVGKTKKNMIGTKCQIDEANISKLAVLRRLEEATEEVLHSKQVLEDALNKVETANRKQHDAEEALRRWIPENGQKGHVVYNSIPKCAKLHLAEECQGSPLCDVTKSTPVNHDSKPVLRSTVSMRDVLSRKQVLTEDQRARKDVEDHTERRKVALSQMLRAMREDFTFPPNAETERTEQKQFATQRKKFGFIQISLPISKPSKKRT